MTSLNKALDKFKNLPPEIFLTVDSDFSSELLSAVEKRYGVSLSPALIMIATGELALGGLGQYLEAEYGIETNKAGLIRKEMEENVVKPILERLDFINIHPDKPMDQSREKAYIIKVFKENIRYELSGHPLLRSAVNRQIFKLLSRDIRLKDDLARALLDSSEIFTAAGINLEGKAARPTVGNWLKGFIDIFGTDIFDNLAIIRFVTDTENGKRLDQAEKDRLTKLLMVYRNIRFFPDSMPTDDGRGWEIIPINDSDTDGAFYRKKLSLPMTEEEEQIDRLKQEEESYKENSLERLALEEEIAKKKKVEQVLAMANRYPKGSLEYRAVMEEVEKIKKR